MAAYTAIGLPTETLSMPAIRWILLISTLIPLSSFADAPVDFSGDWVATDAAANATSATPADNSHSHGHGGHGGGGMGGGHGMGGHGNRGGGSGSAQNSSTNVEVSTSVPRLKAHALIIRQSDDVFDIDADGRRLAYRFDGKHNYGPVYGGTVSLSWSAPDMVIETHPDSGGSIEEHYTLTPDGKKLSLRLRMQDAGADTAYEMARVFVRKGQEDQATKGSVTLP
jgi:hypothetical protein